MTSASPASITVLEALFPGDDESARLARSINWADTPLGEPSTWSPELCAAVRTVMPSRVPMLLWWGDELVQIYNLAYRSMLGSKHPAAMGQPAAVCWPEVWDDLGPKVAQVRETGEASYDQELLLFVDRHGYLEETYWTFSYSPIRSAGGDVIGVFVATTDVSLDRVEARRLDTIRDLAVLSSADFSSVHEAVGRVTEILARNRWAVPFAVVYLKDAEGHLAAVSQYGLPVPTEKLPERLAAASRHAVAGVARSREPVVQGFDPEELLATPGPLGPQRPSAAYLMPLGSAGRELEGVLVLGLNPYRLVDHRYTTFATLVARQLTALLTDVRATSVERERAMALAELDRNKSLFFANVSHEFRTPVTVALVAAAELRRSGLSEEQRGHVDAVERAAARLNRLVDTLLDFARSEAGQLTPQRTAVDLTQTTRDVVAMFRSAVESAGLALLLELDEVGSVCADREAWIKIVANLVSNAYKFTESGSIVLRLRRDDDRVTLSVADTGRGISPDEAPLVFERFHQVTGQPARGVAGTGIGLALVKDIVAAQHGEVDLESSLGVGTTVTVSLPVADAPGSSGPEDRRHVVQVVGSLAAELEPAPVPARTVTTSAPGPHVLLVEDHADLRGYLSRLLSDDGWTVTAVPDVSSALRVERLPDVILSDLMLPGHSGIDLVRMVRAQDHWGSTPIVLLTARSGSAEVAEGLAAGANDYVRKPFDPVELLARLRTHYELATVHGRRLAEAEDRATNLQTAVTTNRQIGVAVGVVMSREKVTSEQAFELLRRLSNRTNRKLREVAEEVALTGELTDQDAGPRRVTATGPR
ncbi:MAG TPA: ATP-binding protein [Lapillicoccus sp.]|nr:ATP-binding protein [Lapillicoccus sp.]